MTREEAIEILKANYPSKCFEQLCEAVDMAIKALEQGPTYYPPCIDCNKKMGEIRRAYDKLKPQEPKWIPCSERLPKESGEYLVTFGEITTMGETIEKWVGFDNFATYGRWCNKCMQPVVAWMPLPEPYQGERRGVE